MTAAPTAVASLLPSAPTPRVYVGAGALLLGVQLCCLLAWHAPNTAGLSPALAQLRLDPNRAPAAELVLLPDIGPALAGRIMKYRASVTDGPAFRTAEDLDRVPGIGPAKVAKLRPYLEFAGEAASRPIAAPRGDPSAAARPDVPTAPRTDLPAAPRTAAPGAQRIDPSSAVPEPDVP
jgi:competence protein ComEA